jgi:elongation factor 1 alpha-like protein
LRSDPATFSSWVGRPQTCSSSFSAVDFFQDCPWLNIPLRRQGVILIEPLYPRGRLLGGASQSPGTPKVSKLAALAAAKKKKELEKNRDGEVKAASSSIALLDKLNMGMKPSTEQPSISVQALKENKNNRIDSEGLSRAGNIRRYPTRRPKTPSPPLPPVIKQEELLKPDDPDPAFSDLVAKPSPFARIILGSLSNRLPLYFLANHFSPSYSLQGKLPESNPFAGPSPDDIVAKAQSASKGLAKQGQKG